MNIQTPALTLSGVKAFAKMLRSRMLTGNRPSELATELITELVIHGPRVIPTTTGGIANPEPVTWVIGSAGSGKSNLAYFSALLATTNRRRVIYINEGFDPHYRDLFCDVHGFQEIEVNPEFPGDELRHHLKTRRHLFVKPRYYDGNSPDAVAQVTEIFGAVGKADLRETLLILDNFPVSVAPSLMAPLIRQAGREGFQMMVVGQTFDVPPLHRDLIQAADAKVVTHRFPGSGYEDNIPVDVIRRASTFKAGYAAFVSGGRSEDFRFPLLREEPDFVRALKTWSEHAVVSHASLKDRIEASITSQTAPLTHTEALEITAKLLGYSSWHAIEGHLKK